MNIQLSRAFNLYSKKLIILPFLLHKNNYIEMRIKRYYNLFIGFHILFEEGVLKMSFINWTKEELTNIKLIDQQHKETTDLINEIYESNSKQNKKAQVTFIKNLIAHLREHFETEEKYMKEFSDTGYISHKLEHDRLLNKIISTESKLNEDDLILDEEFFQSMRKWFYNHLDFKDRKLGEHLRTKNVK